TGWAEVSFQGLLARYTQLVEDLAPIEKHVREEAARDPVAQALDRIPGIGAVLGLMIRAEVGTMTRFVRPAQLASYAGVVPRVSRSGSVCHHGPITREGSPWLRWALIEAATHGIRRPDAIGAWARRLAVRKGGLKARAAVARRLCDEIFVAWMRIEGLSGAAVEIPLATSDVVVP
ncbi:MAG: transposase, partial [Burkholderiales bacterium]